VVVGFDPVHARSVQRSFTVHRDEEAAEQRRRELVDDFGNQAPPGKRIHNPGTNDVTVRRNGGGLP
jgi:hypothetical protein